jgi:hypothetical protein
MRLLNTSTLEFKEFFKPPSYAILSHRWGVDEVSFSDYESKRNLWGPGYQKIVSCCHFARQRSHEWVWIDTCCIDKRSSAELSEAINSMWEWYSKAQECYAHLSDVTSLSQEKPFHSDSGKPSAWFTRGWTLQELLAPRKVIFCNSDWKVIGQKADPALLAEITKITSIPSRCLSSHFSLNNASVAQKFSWASRRVTTRAEDMAYCLLGLVGVNMPLLYGEGDKAFLRLQQEIIRQSDDESIFAWYIPDAPVGQVSGILAPSIEHFANSSDVKAMLKPRHPYAVTNKGLDFTALSHKVSDTMYMIPLNCQYGWDHRSSKRCAIVVREEQSLWSRIHVDSLGQGVGRVFSTLETEELVEYRFLIRLSRWQNEYGPAIAVITDFLRRTRGKAFERLAEYTLRQSNVDLHGHVHNESTPQELE